MKKWGGGGKILKCKSGEKMIINVQFIVSSRVSFFIFCSHLSYNHFPPWEGGTLFWEIYTPAVQFTQQLQETRQVSTVQVNSDEQVRVQYKYRNQSGTIHSNSVYKTEVLYR